MRHGCGGTGRGIAGVGALGLEAVEFVSGDVEAAFDAAFVGGQAVKDFAVGEIADEGFSEQVGLFVLG